MFELAILTSDVLCFCVAQRPCAIAFEELEIHKLIFSNKKTTKFHIEA